MQAIDVVLLTKNSEHLLAQCLTSIYQNVPVNNLIVVDGVSTDGTLQILEKFNRQHGNIKVFSLNGSRAKAREKGISHVETEWFLFVDSDVILCPDWFKKAQKDLQPDVGAVWGVNIDVIPNMTYKRVVKLQSLIARHSFTLRGGTHDTLIRRKLVWDIKIPEELHTYEDSYIMKWIRAKGYKTVIGNDVYCLHYKPPENWKTSNAVANAILEFKCGLIYSKNFAYMVYYPFFMCYWFLQIALQKSRNLLPH
ncbi:MAG: glycosyltransferase family 2 protein [Candidatus Bathyarchaeia archaeon]|jgi:glycosyltransferase involved in cell wall biosynthesis